jgi:SAM-dependent methyltransferase
MELAMFGELQYWLLCKLWPIKTIDTQPHGEEKLATFIKPIDPTFGRLEGLDVLDFGCGDGNESIALSRCARSVIGLDINPKWIEIARAKAQRAGVSNVEFTTKLDRKVDAVISIDAFEHFEDPKQILEMMHDALRPGGIVIASFGPTWYHPYGGHLFSAFPWAHLLCSERALLKWRNRFRDGKAQSLKQGMNGWSISRFERTIRDSPFTVEQFDCVPINSLRRIHCRLTREITTSIVQMRVRKT